MQGGWDKVMEEQFWKDFAGAWSNEPDVMDLMHGKYHLVVLRGGMGNLNGYVGVKITNPLFGLHYDHQNLYDVSVHGGLSFSNIGMVIPQFKNNYWYFGFDTAHAFDVVPQLEAMRKAIPKLRAISEEMHSQFGSHDTYRDFNYVSDQVNNLYEQIKEIADSLPKKETNFRKMYRKLHKIKMRMVHA